jgi:outer membrane lipoprotein LolB
MSLRVVAMLAGVALLAGCQAVPVRSGAALADPAQVAQAQALLATREAALGLPAGTACDAPGWQLSGRAALSNGREGGSGRIDWLQGSGSTQVTLSAPVTRQSWTLTAGPTGAALDGVPNGPLRGSDAGELLHQATGWRIPVGALGCWLRGARADAATHGEAVVAYGADLRPLRIQQAGWTVEFSDWVEAAAGGQVLPGRIQAQRGEDRVRLLVDDWGSE